jgi:hypothetical protein
MLTIPQLQAIQEDDPYTGEAFRRVVNAINQLAAQVGVDAMPAPQTPTGAALATGGTAKTLPKPAAPASLAVSAARGTFNVIVGPSAGGTPAVLYFLEVASDTGFSAAGTVVYPLGGTLQLSVNLGNVTRYFRARAKYPQSDYSGYVYLGTAANPTAVSGGQTSLSTDVSGQINLGSQATGILPGSMNDVPVNAIFTIASGLGLTQNGTTTQINVASGTIQFGSGTVSYNSGSVDPGAYGTYFIYCDDPTYAGGAVTYQATTTFSAVTANKGRLYLGKIVTSSAGGGSGGGGGGW